MKMSGILQRIRIGIVHPDRLLRYVRSRFRGPQLIDQTFNDSEACILSFPKAGRTWLRVLLGKLIHDVYGLTDPDALFLEPELTRQAGIPPIYISHERIRPRSQTGGKVIESKSRYADKKVLLMVRDIRDIIVSYYHHNHKRDLLFDGTISEFIRSERFGVAKAIAFYKAWYDNQHVPKAFMLVRYEDLHLNIEHTLPNIVSFLGLEQPTESQIAAAIAFSTFKNMQAMELSGTLSAHQLSRKGEVQDVNSRKTRSGKIGGYTQELNQSDLDYIDDVMKQLDGPRDWLYYSP